MTQFAQEYQDFRRGDSLIFISSTCVRLNLFSLSLSRRSEGRNTCASNSPTQLSHSVTHRESAQSNVSISSSAADGIALKLGNTILLVMSCRLQRAKLLWFIHSGFSHIAFLTVLAKVYHNFSFSDISSAAAVYSIAAGCSRGNISICGCYRHPYVQRDQVREKEKKSFVFSRSTD